MAEDYTFPAPVQVDPGAARFRIASLVFDWQRAVVAITLREWDGTGFLGRQVYAVYEGAVATTMMVGLNKVNLTTRSLHQRVLDRLIADGKIPAGTIAGTVD